VRPAANGDPDAPIVYIGAHIDSVVGSPGASDNGSGTSIMLELARILGQYSLDTEIRVGAWGAEEIGILGSKHHVSTMTSEEIDRTIGAWNMDMAGTSFAGNPGQEFGFWALTVDGDTSADNVVLGLADEVSNIAGYGDLQIGQVGRSDHQSFRDAGIEAAVFSWMFWAGGTNIVLEPAYHMTTDTLEFVSQERMGIAAEVLGGAAFRAALNEVDVEVTDEHGEPAVGTEVAMSCEGDEGWRGLGATGDDGGILAHVPHTSCDFVAMAANGARGSALDVPFTGDGAVSIALQVDDEAPVVEFSADPAAAATGWHVTAPVTVSLAAADDADDAPALEYSLDGIAWSAYSESIVFAEDGVHTLYARAADDFGNSSGPVSEAFRIDTVSPTLSVSADPSSRGRVAISAFDATSGVASVEYRAGGAGDWTALEPPAGGWSDASTAQVKLDNGAVQLQFRAVDAAGHVSSIGSLSFAAVPGASLSSTGAETTLAAVAALAAVLLAAGGALFALRRRRVPTGDGRE